MTVQGVHGYDPFYLPDLNANNNQVQRNNLNTQVVTTPQPVDSVELNNQPQKVPADTVQGVPGYDTYDLNTSNNQIQGNNLNIEAVSSQQPEKITAENDGKFSILEFGKNFGKGVWDFGANIVKNIVKHPLKSLAIIGITAALCATPAGFALITGFGFAISSFALITTGIKAGTNILKGDWDALEKNGKELGHELPGFILSSLGAAKAGRMVAASAAKSSGAAAATEKMGFVESLKTLFTSPKGFFKDNMKYISKAERLGRYSFQYIRSASEALFKTVKGIPKGDANLFKHYRAAFRLNYIRGGNVARTKVGINYRSLQGTVNKVAGRSFGNAKKAVKRAFGFETGKYQSVNPFKIYAKQRHYLQNSLDKRGLEVLRSEVARGKSPLTPEELDWWSKNNNFLKFDNLSNSLLPKLGITAPKTVEKGELMVIQ